jgi:hypothetical protein
MIDPKYYGIIEMAFFAIVVLGFGAWQLWTVRDTRPSKPEDSPRDPGHPEG